MKVVKLKSQQSAPEQRFTVMVEQQTCNITTAALFRGEKQITPFFRCKKCLVIYLNGPKGKAILPEGQESRLCSQIGKLRIKNRCLPKGKTILPEDQEGRIRLQIS